MAEVAMAMNQTGESTLSESALREQAAPPVGWIAQLAVAEGDGILAMLLRMLGRQADALDAFQECFCKLAAYERAPELHSPRAFAYRIAANIAAEHLRAARLRRKHEPSLASALAARRRAASDQAGDADPGRRLREAIADLPPHLRGVIVLHDLSGWSYEEIGRALGIDPATARVYRRHAIVRLAETLPSEEEA